MIENGQMVFSGTLQDFDNYIEPDSLLLSLDAPPPMAELMAIPGVAGMDPLSATQFRIQFSGSREIVKQIVELSVSGGWQLTEIRIEKSSMDEVFAKLSNKKFDKRDIQL
jgi:ABC-2 type transport system ATP-binding protein